MKRTKTNEIPQAKLSLFLDVREVKRSKQNRLDGTYPVKIRIWDTDAKAVKLRNTGIAMSAEDFKAAMKPRPRTIDQPNRDLLNESLGKFASALKEIEQFTFDALERKVSVPNGESQNIFWLYKVRVQDLTERKQIGTAEMYRLASLSLQRYTKSEKVLIGAITPKWLQGYEDYMVDIGRSLTTVSMYIRTLRAIFNDAIANNEVKQEYYPFGKRKYVIPGSRNVKKALVPAQLRQLWDVKPETEEQSRARDFFFFSYASNGMNIKDIAHLKFADFNEDSFSFLRAKTQNTKKERQIAITVYLNDITRTVIERHGNNPSSSQYVFPIINDGMSATEMFKASQNFTRSINQNIKKLCIANSMQVVTTYWARHSYATVALNKGASMEMMREALGHSSMTTTLNYFAGFGDEAKRKVASSVLDF